MAQGGSGRQADPGAIVAVAGPGAGADPCLPRLCGSLQRVPRAVGWGANQFSPLLIVYRHELKLGAGAVAGLFLVYALTLIPGLLAGGPASDRFGRRPVVWPFAGTVAVATSGRTVAGAAAVLLGLASGLCLVSGLRQAEHMASPDERGAVIACYYALAYLGFTVPYLVDGLGALVGQTGAFIVLTVIIGLLTTGYAVSLRPGVRHADHDALVRLPAEDHNSRSQRGNTGPFGELKIFFDRTGLGASRSSGTSVTTVVRGRCRGGGVGARCDP